MKMKLNVKGLIAALLCLLLLCGCGAKTAPETVRKTPVAPVAPPEHVAAIIASFAETWLLAGGELSAAFSNISSPVSSMAPLCRS